MNNIFSQLPTYLIMNIIKMETMRKHEQEFEDFVNDMIYNYDPNDYEDYYDDVNQYGMTASEVYIPLEYRDNSTD